MRRLFFYLIGICLLKPAFSWGQNSPLDNYAMTYITMDDGLLHNYIDDIYKDSKGFIWLSTGSGLSRYDGYRFVHYNMNSNPVALRGGFVHKAREDNFNRLWIISEGGLDILDLETHRQVHLFAEADSALSFLRNPIINILKDAKGDIWLYSDAIYKIKLDETGKVAQILTEPGSLHSSRFVAMSDVDKDGNIWAGFHDKVYKLYPAKEGVLQAVPVSDKLTFDPNTTVMKFLLKENDVWIGTDRGLYRYYRNEDVLKVYRNQTAAPRSLSHDYVSDLVLTDNKQLVAGTLKGINVYNSLTDGFDHITEENEITRKGLNSNFINSIFFGDGILWIGSETGGINKLSPKNPLIKSYTYTKDLQGSISKNPVNAILEDEEANLWIGTVEGGLNLKKKGEETFTHYTTASSTRLSHNSVSTLSVDRLDRLWVGTWGMGISVIDRKNPARTALKYINSANQPGFFPDFVGVLCYDEINNGMWIGSNQGLFFHDIERDELVVPFKDGTSSNISGAIGSIIDEDDKLWLGCGEGVYVIDLHRGPDGYFSYEHLKYKLDEPGSKLVDKITSMCMDSDTVLWLGSDGFGIYKREKNDHGNYSFTAYTTSDGLANNNVKGILEDDFNNLWISTNNCLSCFNKENNSFTNYFKEDGLISNQFYWNAFYKSNNGLLYFGTVEGLIAINPEIVKSEAADYKVTFTDLYVDNKKVYPGKIIKKDISGADEIVLHEKQQAFSINFSALNYRKTGSHVYVYRLSGYNDKWIELNQNDRSVNYMNLPPGNYSLEVKYVPKDRIDTGTPTRVDIRIKPYFYKTTWFISLVVILFVISIILLYLWRVRLYEQHRKVLEQIVEDRTEEIKKQKSVLQEQKNELSQQNKVLSQQNEKITKQKEQLVTMSEEVQKMTTERLDFFTNISHEFRTPITLIAGPVKRALKLSTNPYVVEQLNFVERNSNYLLSLINQLMDFRKIESGKLEPTYSKGHFLEFIEALVSPFDFQAKERNIQLVRRFNVANPIFYYDDEGTRKIMTNLLSNAIKYTPDNGKITVYVASLTETKTGKETLYLSVKDSGTGIREADKEKIFERFYQSGDNHRYPVHGQSGTGIGLYLSKQVIESLNGEIRVKNNKKTGCTFRVLLPLQRTHPKPMELNYREDFNLEEVEPKDYNLKEWHKDKLTFLVVEDNKDMQRYVCSILAPYYNTIEAANGVEAYEILENYHVDFIISDLVMPEMDGLALSKKVKENFSLSHIPFIMLTAKTSEETRTDSYRTGVDSYIVKPFDEEMLLTRVENILETRERYQHKFMDHMSVDVLEINEESNDKKFMDRALEVMQQNYQNSYFEVSDFVEAMGVSKSLLNKKLNALTGKAAGEFIRTYRLNLAYNIILHNKETKNKNISDIAYEVGFNDPKYFTRCFSKQFNITPSKLMGK